MSGDTPRVRASWGWPWPATLGYFGVISLALAVPFAAGAATKIDANTLSRLVMLAALSIIYSVIVRSKERIRRAIAQNYCPNLQGVWIMAAVVALPPRLLPIIGAIAYSAEWWQQRGGPRPVPLLGRRHIVSGSAMVLACTCASLIVGTAPSHAPSVVLLSDVLDLALILGMGALLSGPVAACERLGALLTPRNLIIDVVAVLVGCGAGLLTSLPGSAITVALISLPALVWVQSMSVEAEKAAAAEAATGLPCDEAWLAMASELVSWPTAVFYVGLPLEGAGTDLLRTRQAIEGVTRAGDPLIGRYQGGFAIVDPKLRLPMANNVVLRIEDELHTLDIGGVVEATVAVSAQDLHVALADVVHSATRRL